MPDLNKRFGISVYGPQMVRFIKVIDNPSRGISLPDMLKESLLEKALSEGEDEWNKMGSVGTYSRVFSNFEHSNIGYGFYAFRNDSDKDVEITLTMTKGMNVRYCK